MLFFIDFFLFLCYHMVNNIKEVNKMIVKDLFEYADPNWIIDYKIRTSENFKTSYEKFNDNEKENLKNKIKNDIQYIQNVEPIKTDDFIYILDNVDLYTGHVYYESGKVKKEDVLAFNFDNQNENQMFDYFNGNYIEIYNLMFSSIQNTASLNIPDFVINGKYQRSLIAAIFFDDMFYFGFEIDDNVNARKTINDLICDENIEHKPIESARNFFSDFKNKFGFNDRENLLSVLDQEFEINEINKYNFFLKLKLELTEKSLSGYITVKDLLKNLNSDWIVEYQKENSKEVRKYYNRFSDSEKNDFEKKILKTISRIKTIQETKSRDFIFVVKSVDLFDDLNADSFYNDVGMVKFDDIVNFSTISLDDLNNNNNYVQTYAIELLDIERVLGLNIPKFLFEKYTEKFLACLLYNEIFCFSVDIDENTEIQKEALDMLNETEEMIKNSDLSEFKTIDEVFEELSQTIGVEIERNQNDNDEEIFNKEFEINENEKRVFFEKLKREILNEKRED